MCSIAEEVDVYLILSHSLYTSADKSWSLILKLSLFWKSGSLVLLLKCIVGSLSSKGGGIFWGNARDTSPADQRHQDNSFLHTSGSPCHSVTISQCLHITMSPCHYVTVSSCHNVSTSPWHSSGSPCHTSTTQFQGLTSECFGGVQLFPPHIWVANLFHITIQYTYI